MKALLEGFAVADQEEFTARLVRHLLEQLRVDGVVGGSEDRTAEQTGALLDRSLIGDAHQDGVDLDLHGSCEICCLGWRHVASV